MLKIRVAFGELKCVEAQRNEYATGLVELGNRAESVLQERNVEYSEELARG